MATCRSIINGALRKIGRLGAGREPRLPDQTDALAALQGLYLSWVVAGAFGRLADVIPLADFTVAENMRVVRSAATVTITLPDTVPMYSEPLPYNLERDTYDTNYESVDGANRPPRDGAVVEIVDTLSGTSETWIYDGTLRAWTSIEALQLDDQAPRSIGDPEGLSATLAMELVDAFGATLGPGTQRQAARYMTAMTSNYSRPREAVMGVYC